MVTAYLNHGRWVADCPCNSGILVDKGPGLYLCRECHTLNQITMHEDWQTVEMLTKDRLPKHRNWTPGEPIGNLMAENVEHGVGPADLIAAAEK